MSESTRPQVVMTSEQYAARQLAEEMAAQRENPLDVAKVPGGVFQRLDGSYQNAHGQTVTQSGKVVEGDAPAPAPDAVAEPVAERPAAKRR